jgi:hypothetical protein
LYISGCHLYYGSIKKISRVTLQINIEVNVL